MKDLEYRVKGVLVSEEEAKEIVERLGKQISKDYAGKNLVLVSVLKGAVVFMADLMRAIDIPLSIDFMVVSSYNKTESTGTVKIIKDLDTDLTGKDILDTGRTLASLMEILKMRNPASLKICTFLDKPDRRVSQISAEYIGKVIPDEFVVGYGLDYDESYRNLPYVGIYDPED